MDIATMLNEARADGTLMRLATDPAAQFGTKVRRYVGAELLPERPVSVNDYIEDRINYRTIVANAGTRYSPAQKKGGSIHGSFPVHLAHQDIASEFTSKDYDALVAILRGAGAFVGPLVQNQMGMQAMARVTNWLDTTVVQALVEVLEMYRWQAITDKLVTLTGDNSYNDVVRYPSYPDLSFAASGAATDNTFDPFTDIFNLNQAMTNRGVTPGRIIIGRTALNKILNNALVRARVGRVVVNTAGQIRGTTGAATLAEVNSALNADGLPPFELYDLFYRTELGAKPFLRRDALVMVGQTGRNETIDLGDGQYETVENVIGYTAVGVAVGQATPGRYIRAEYEDDKPPRIEAEGWQTALPVITEPEAFGVITNIR